MAEPPSTASLIVTGDAVFSAGNAGDVDGLTLSSGVQFGRTYSDPSLGVASGGATTGFVVTGNEWEGVASGGLAVGTVVEARWPAGPLHRRCRASI